MLLRLRTSESKDVMLGKEKISLADIVYLDSSNSKDDECSEDVKSSIAKAQMKKAWRKKHSN
jgi:hypothetical protein